MTPRQFSALTGIEHSKVIEWIRSGKLLGISYGKSYLITESEYRRYVSEGLRYDPEEVELAKERRENHRLRYHEIRRLNRETEESKVSRMGSAEGPEIEGLDDESEFYDGQEDFYD